MYGYGYLSSVLSDGQFVADTDDLAGQGDVAPLNISGAPLPSLVTLYPGRFVNPKYWGDPFVLGSEPFGITGIPKDFTIVEGMQPEEVMETLGISDWGDPTRIFIPQIDVNSGIDNLGLTVSEEGFTSYETPQFTVGFIPETAAPGEGRAGWYFGHLQSVGEGNIFRNLPQLVELAKSDPVSIYIETAEAVFLYRVNTSYQVHRDDLSDDIYSPSLGELGQQIYLCTCWPPLNYTQRVVVRADLVAVRPHTVSS